MKSKKLGWLSVVALTSAFSLSMAEAAPRQVEEILVDPIYNTDVSTFFWSDSASSDIASGGVFSDPIAINSISSQWRNRGWPEGRRLLAIYDNPTAAGVKSFFWDDDTYSDYNLSSQTFNVQVSLHQARSFWSVAGWPLDKKINAIFQNPTLPDAVMYFWDDGTYSEYNKLTQRFSDYYNLLQPGSYWQAAGWPQGKKVKAIYPNPEISHFVMYFWDDGTYSDFDLSHQRFTGTVSIAQAGSYWQAKGWPESDIPDGNRVQVTSVRSVPTPSGLHVIHTISGDGATVNLGATRVVSQDGEQIIPANIQRNSAGTQIVITFNHNDRSRRVKTTFTANTYGSNYTVTTNFYTLPYYDGHEWH